MMKKISVIGLIFLGISASLYADCTFVYSNKTTHPVTLQGFFVKGGDGVNQDAWVTVPATRKLAQIRSGSNDCKSALTHTSEIAAKVNLKNGTGGWHANSGIFGFGDKVYSTSANAKQAVADDGSNIILSSQTGLLSKEYRVDICDDSITPGQCH